MSLELLFTESEASYSFYLPVAYSSDNFNE
jgi:hypothetical protein